MSNSILTPQVITNELLRRFQNNLGFARVVHHEDYSEHFAKAGAKIGDTLSLRDPVRFAATPGATLVVQDVEERKIPLTINTRYHSAFQFDSQELTLSIDRIGERYIEGTAIALANRCEIDGLTVAYQNTPNLVGTAGGGPPSGATAFQTYLSAFEALDRNSCPFDGERFVCITSKYQTQIIDTLKGLFQSSEQIKRQNVKGRMGDGAGFTWLLAQNIRTTTLGNYGTPVINGSGQVGSSLSINGFTASQPCVFAGDNFTIAGNYALNPVSGDVLTDLRQFTILNNGTADSNGQCTVNIYPAIALYGDPSKPNPYATCSISPNTGTAVTFYGNNALGGTISSLGVQTIAGSLSPQALAFHKEAFAWACVPLTLPRAVEMAKRATDPDTGMSIRTVSQYDGVNDIFFTRADVMYGWVTPRRDWACRLAA